MTILSALLTVIPVLGGLSYPIKLALDHRYKRKDKQVESQNAVAIAEVTGKYKIQETELSLTDKLLARIESLEQKREDDHTVCHEKIDSLQQAHTKDRESCAREIQSLRQDYKRVSERSVKIAEEFAAFKQRHNLSIFPSTPPEDDG